LCQNRLVLNLSELRKGEKGIIGKISRADVFLKLLDMGCVAGEEIQVQFIAPMGDPIAILVSGYTICIRIAEARVIEIKKI
jgi:ferrous iron transport protein A